ncbi:similar to Saccharomyces cerevisiae YMR228W MTF1 Mitochondrial RNA polymerase specificity factor with structural similarity to S-adenosylmethionine-dependent methyltransferases and functional similarity to bacterial sigma-factors [Maudiozyma saulgeensis]|uniref:rRNA adenine N(6)-methyltransferase n=1 Tax=Maudiozyma saulgeensis TaxID=1789683 RepID=A0A1X7R906_9SACH|nr:similar to Saccharomyces cerevisiae YMR228W MTF1 Mitochondrial RNA polymerase specificity factor with structural similarity to S-adenosylmethionine-dependent methyltransferases and functional similarity to bacterial sigma-factors [Kazachstania saulgeensis]
MFKPLTATNLSEIKVFYKFRYVVSPRVLENIFDKLRLEDTYGDCKDLKVMDLNAGPAQQSIIFNNRYRCKQHLLMDNRPQFTNFWERNLKKSHFQMSPQDPYDWESYLMLIDHQKLFVPEKQPRDHIHNKFLIMGNLTDKKEEGLLMQWYNCVGQKNWLQRFGRVKMLLWVPTSSARKLLAPASSTQRAKCSLVCETFTDSKIIALTQDEESDLFDKKLLDKFDPIWVDYSSTLPQKFSKTKKSPMCLLEIDPLDFELNKGNWDYVTQHLMIQKSTPLIDAIESLGPGATDFFTKQINDPEFMKRCPYTFSAEEFIYLSDIYFRWPFKPDVFMNLFNAQQEE